MQFMQDHQPIIRILLESCRRVTHFRSACYRYTVLPAYYRYAPLNRNWLILLVYDKRHRQH
eukprot:scaffold26205_cov40-Prasinocladus_malaysianus.AAC.1